MENISHTKHELATTNVAFVFGPADSIYLAKTITTSGLILTALDGTTVDYGLAPNGTVIDMACTKAVFAGGPAGAVVAMRRPSPARDT